VNLPGAGTAGGRAAPAPCPGLVRLETSDPIVRPFFERERIKAARKRGLRLFKSLSVSGDLLKDHQDARGRRLRRLFVTLTYRPDVDWQAGQITRFVKAARKWHDRLDCRLRIVWVAEQHASGRIHYHAILFLRRDLSLPKPDKAGWWPYGMSQIQEARKGVGYLMKYATKVSQVAAPWPKGCRLHGHGGLDAVERDRRSWWVLPRYVRELVTPDHRVRRARGGGWISTITGEWWPAWSGPVQAPPVGARGLSYAN